MSAMCISLNSLASAAEGNLAEVFFGLAYYLSHKPYRKLPRLTDANGARRDDARTCMDEERLPHRSRIEERPYYGCSAWVAGPASGRSPAARAWGCFSDSSLGVRGAGSN